MWKFKTGIYIGLLSLQMAAKIAYLVMSEGKFVTIT